MTAGPAEIHISGVSGIPEIASGDDVARLIADAALAEGGPGLRAGDILVVTSKIVSKAEGRVVSATRENAIAAPNCPPRPFGMSRHNTCNPSRLALPGLSASRARASASPDVPCSSPGSE